MDEDQFNGDILQWSRGDEATETSGQSRHFHQRNSFNGAVAVKPRSLVGQLQLDHLLLPSMEPWR